MAAFFDLSHSVSLRLLVVEDNLAYREVLSETLETAGHHVVGLDCAEEVCELLVDWCFDVALLDLNLPGEDGLTLASRLRHVCPEMGIIMVTARGALDQRCLGYECGADLYLTKPVDTTELLLAIQSLGRRLNKVGPEEGQDTLELAVGAGQLISSAPEVTVGLNRREVSLLQKLALAPGHELETWQLIEDLDEDFGSRAKQNLEVTLSRLRSKLRQSGIDRPIVRARRGVGYRLCLPLRIA